MARRRHPFSMLSGKKSKDVTLDEAVFAAEIKPHLVHETVRAEAAAARAGTRAAKSRGHGLRRGAPSRGGRRAPAAPARARPGLRSGRAAASPSRPTPRIVRPQGQSQGPQGRLPRSALGPRRARDARGPRRRGVRASPRPRQPRRFLAAWGAELPLLVVAQPEEQALVKSLPQPAEVCSSSSRPTLEVGAIVWARSVLVTEGALERVSEAMSEVSLDPRQVIIAPVVSEKSYSLIEDNKYSFKVHPKAHKTQIRQAVEELFDVKVVSRERRQGEAEAEAARPSAAGRGPAGRRRSSSSATATRSRSSRERRSKLALRKYKPTIAGPALPLGLDLRGDHEDRAREEPGRAREAQGRPQQPRPDHDAPPGRRSQAALPRHRLQAP